MIVQICTRAYNNFMKLTVSEARQKLPELVRRVRADADLRILITVHGDTAAELRACPPEPAPGAAARRLKELMADLPGSGGRKRRVSEEVGKHLYGKRSK